jgi:hypothetical protein
VKWNGLPCLLLSKGIGALHFSKGQNEQIASLFFPVPLVLWVVAVVTLNFFVSCLSNLMLP